MASEPQSLDHDFDTQDADDGAPGRYQGQTDVTSLRQASTCTSSNQCFLCYRNVTLYSHLQGIVKDIGGHLVQIEFWTIPVIIDSVQQ